MTCHRGMSPPPRLCSGAGGISIAPGLMAGGGASGSVAGRGAAARRFARYRTGIKRSLLFACGISILLVFRFAVPRLVVFEGREHDGSLKSPRQIPVVEFLGD